jgi:hypothetical protein
VSDPEQHRTGPRPPLPSPFDAPPGYSRFGSGPFSAFTRLTVHPPPSFIQGSPIMAWGKSSVSVRGMWPEGWFAREDGFFHCTLSRSWSLAVRDGFAGVLATVLQRFRCCSEPLTLAGKHLTEPRSTRDLRRSSLHAGFLSPLAAVPHSRTVQPCSPCLPLDR